MIRTHTATASRISDVDQNHQTNAIWGVSRLFKFPVSSFSPLFCLGPSHKTMTWPYPPKILQWSQAFAKVMVYTSRWNRGCEGRLGHLQDVRIFHEFVLRTSFSKLRRIFVFVFKTPPRVSAQKTNWRRYLEDRLWSPVHSDMLYRCMVAESEKKALVWLASRTTEQK